MKTKLTLLGSLATLGAAASLNAQSAVTAAVGYHTEALVPGFNVVGVNVGTAVSAAGDFDAATANDADVDFTTLLTVGTPYTVQNLTTGDVASVDSFTANDLTTTPVLTPTAGDTYEIRQDQTIDDLFGPANEAGLLEGDRLDADVIWVPDSMGGYKRYYRNNVTDANFLDPKSPGWRELADGATDAGGTVIPFYFAMFIQVRDPAPDPIVFVGHVRGEDDVDDGHGAPKTNIDVVNGFNVINRIVPVEITLAELGAAAMLTPGERDTADILWNPDKAGGYVRYYNNNVTDANFLDPKTPGLREIADGTTDQSDAPICSGFLLQRKAADGSVAVTVPARLDL